MAVLPTIKCEQLPGHPNIFESKTVNIRVVEIPAPWLWISGIFFLINIIFFIILTIALVKVMQVAQEMKPKIERISDRLDSISEKVDTIAGEVQGRVTDLSQTSGKLLTTAEAFTSASSQLVGRFAPYIAGFGLVLKAYQMAKEHGVNFSRKPKPKALPARAKEAAKAAAEKLKS